MMFRRCECCRKIRLWRNVIYVKMYGNDRSGYYCFECLKGYILSSIKDFKEYINSPRFRSGPKFLEKLKEVKKILQV